MNIKEKIEELTEMRARLISSPELAFTIIYHLVTKGTNFVIDITSFPTAYAILRSQGLSPDYNPVEVYFKCDFPYCKIDIPSIKIPLFSLSPKCVVFQERDYYEADRVYSQDYVIDGKRIVCYSWWLKKGGWSLAKLDSLSDLIVYLKKLSWKGENKKEMEIKSGDRVRIVNCHCLYKQKCCIGINMKNCIGLCGVIKSVLKEGGKKIYAVIFEDIHRDHYSTEDLELVDSFVDREEKRYLQLTR